MRRLTPAWMFVFLLVPAAAPQPPPGWKLVWSDEFDKDGRPDPAKWTYEKRFVRNRELQWYQPDNARCEKGLLIIEGRRERAKNPDYLPGSANWKTNREYAEYTSATLTTKGLQSWRYARFEMRGRIDMWSRHTRTARDCGRTPARGPVGRAQP